MKDKLMSSNIKFSNEYFVYHGVRHLSDKYLIRGDKIKLAPKTKLKTTIKEYTVLDLERNWYKDIDVFCVVDNKGKKLFIMDFDPKNKKAKNHFEEQRGYYCSLVSRMEYLLVDDNNRLPIKDSFVFNNFNIKINENIYNDNGDITIGNAYFKTKDFKLDFYNTETTKVFTQFFSAEYIASDIPKRTLASYTNDDIIRLFKEKILKSLNDKLTK